jgi:predicted nuclease of restriction endonuclease-like (RecB) superfamily
MTPSRRRDKARTAVAAEADERAFAEVLDLILSSREEAVAALNATLIDLYWRIGEFLARRGETDGWGRSTVAALSSYLQRTIQGLQGFSPQNLWRMRQFFDAYRDQPQVMALLRQLPWSANLHVLTKCKRPQEREFYLRMSVGQRWTVREIARQIDGALFERAVLNPPKVSKALRELHPQAEDVFRDAYLVEYLGLPDGHLETDLHAALVRNMQRFLTELGRDFCFIGSEVPLQVGGKDFSLDLLFFHRELSCLVAIELKIGEFVPEYLGKLEFYLEALDRDVRKPRERPSIGVLLCASKDNEVVEYALSRSMSPTLIAEYQTTLPDRKLLQAKLHEFYKLTEGHAPCAPERLARLMLEARRSEQRSRPQRRRLR